MTFVEYVQRWVDIHNTTWDALYSEAKLSSGTATGHKTGSLPKPTTLRKLAKAMQVPEYELFAVAGYSKGVGCEDADLTPEKLALLREYEYLDEEDRPTALRLIRALRG